jgi:hypothetical protein
VPTHSRIKLIEERYAGLCWDNSGRCRRIEKIQTRMQHY